MKKKQRKSAIETIAAAICMSFVLGCRLIIEAERFGKVTVHIPGNEVSLTRYFDILPRAVQPYLWPSCSERPSCLEVKIDIGLFGEICQYISDIDKEVLKEVK